METLLSTFKAIIVVITSSILAYLTPVKDIMLCIMISFTANFLTGYIAGIVTQCEMFSLKKAKVAIYEAVVYLLLIAIIFTLGEKMGDKEWALKCLSIITYAWIYFYLVNILKNLKRLFPLSRGLAFVYYVVSLEFVKRFPYLKDFIDSEKNKENGQ